MLKSNKGSESTIAIIKIWGDDDDVGKVSICCYPQLF
jgi:hypothetical protein